MSVFSACQHWSELSMSQEMHLLLCPYDAALEASVNSEQQARYAFTELLRLGIGINETKGSLTALHMASILCNSDAVLLLLRKGIDTSIKTKVVF